jgi:hypothetical protein
MTGGAIAAALRARSFAVIEVTPDLLATRALTESPRAIIIDVDQPGAIAAVERTRELLPASPPEIFCLGDPLRAAEIGATRAAGKVFGRPIDISAVVAAIARAAPSLQGEQTSSSFGQRRPTLPLRTSESEPPPPPSELLSSADPLDLVPSSLDEPANHLHPSDLSPELERILTAAEQRVATQHRPSSIPSIPPPDEDLDMLLSPDLLAALDEPLDPDDEGVATGSGGGATSAPKLPTGTGTNRTGGVETTTSEGTVRRMLVNELSAEGRTPVSAAMPPNADLRHDGLPILGSAPEASPPWPSDEARGTPMSPSIDRRSASTLPPSGGPGAPPDVIEVITAPHDVYPPPDPGPLLRHQVAVSIPRTPAAPVIREGGMFAKPAVAAAPPPRDGAPPTKTGASPVLPVSPLPERQRSDRSLAVITPVSGIDAVRGSASPDTTAASHPNPSPQLPAVALGEGDALLALSRAIATRASGALALGAESSLRRIVMHDGDVVTAGSTAADETLLAFLTARGDLPRDVAARIGGKLPPFGRHAGAALIAHGHLGQDDLWPVLRAHAEWIIGRAITCDTGTSQLELEPQGRLKAEPNVFGGATGAEVLVEQVRRVVAPAVALRRIGGNAARLAEGARLALLTECALRREEEALVRSAPGRSVGELLKGAEPELTNVLYALVSLGILDALAPSAPAQAEGARGVDLLDAEALRQRVRARIALVEEGDYFAVLGIPRTATGYEIRRAYIELRRSFEPARVLIAATADLAADVQLILEVLDEAYDLLRDPSRRERYRKAIESGPS